MLARPIVLGTVILWSIYTAAPVRACTCSPPSDILVGSASVFSGRAISVEYLEPDTDTNEPRIRVTFAVTRVWKGPVRKTAVLRTVFNKVSCSGYFFKEGKDYLVAAQKLESDDPKAGTVKLSGISLCGGTRLLSDAGENLAKLGKGRQPK